MDEKEYLPWLALARVKGLGCVGFKRVAEFFDDPRRVFSATRSELAEVPGLEKETIEGILSYADWEGVREEIRRISESGASFVPFNDRRYPSRLRSIPDPPPFLTIKGEMAERDGMAVAVVGSRSASEYGLRMTRVLCHGLASLGFTVISGMARGIDGQAHEAALEANGRTMAVLGSGVDVAYPWEHKGLYEKIIGCGAVLSELPINTPPFPYHFPARNRLISGLSLGVVVVEATEKSGSLITARLALEQGREVFAVPGEAGASRSRGPHRLIRQGAKLVEGVEDILEEVAPQLQSLVGGVDRIPSLALPPEAAPETKRVFELVRRSPLQIDEVIEATGLSPAKVSELLLELEIKGFLTQLPGKRFKAN